ncbi:MAG: hypothetical protein JW892_10310 [Anaerolineae bacterium]|nr:hypothetical protein [Anaerolineae bacterium]
MDNIPIEVFFIPIGLAIVGLIAWLVIAYLQAPGQKKTAPEEGLASYSSQADAQPDVLTVRLNDRGIWEILVYGIPYRSLGSVPNPEAQQKVVDALKILAGFSKTHIQKQQAKAPQTEPGRLDTTDGLPPIPAFREATPSRPAPASVFMPQINLAKEIGEIVEELQARVPSLAKTSIRLQNASGGGVLFIVDGQLYQNLEDIPNLEIQALIRAATRQWERQ